MLLQMNAIFTRENLHLATQRALLRPKLEKQELSPASFNYTTSISCFLNLRIFCASSSVTPSGDVTNTVLRKKTTLNDYQVTYISLCRSLCSLNLIIWAIRYAWSVPKRVLYWNLIVETDSWAFVWARTRQFRDVVVGIFLTPPHISLFSW